MTKLRKLVIVIFVISFAGGAVASFFGHAVIAKIIGSAALVLSVRACFGHIVTLDDDAPGEWSNPERSKAIWSNSVGELFIKVVAVLSVVFLIYV